MRAGNPVLRREVVERWRSRRATITLTLYLAVLGAIMYLLYRLGVAVLDSQFGFGFDPAAAGPVLGRFLVEGLLFFVLLLVLFVGPGYAAAQISGERERKTLTLLQVTLLRPVQIVLGKLGAAVAWLSLLVLAAVPLGAVAFFLGGIGITDLLRSGALLLVVAVAIAAMGLGVSSLTRKTTGSIVLTYGLVLALVGGTLFLSIVEVVFKSTRGQQVSTPVAMYFNPFFGLADAVNASRASSFGVGGLPSPLGIIAEALPGARAMGGFDGDQVAPGVIIQERAGDDFSERMVVQGVDEMVIEDGPAVMIDPLPEPFPRPGQPGRQPVWLIVMAIYTALGALGVLVATRRLRITEPRSRGVPPAPQPVAGAPVGTPAAPGAPATASTWEAPR
jgi:ABC-2 type transport system permease protein